MVIVQLGFPEKVTARAGSTIRLPETSRTGGAISRPPCVSSIQPWNATVAGRCWKLWDPFYHPTEQAIVCRPWRPRMKDYLQCAQRAGLSGGSDARSIASSVRSPWPARFVFSPSEIDQWQNRPLPAFCFSDQTIRKSAVRIARRACSR